MTILIEYLAKVRHYFTRCPCTDLLNPSKMHVHATIPIFQMRKGIQRCQITDSRSQSWKWRCQDLNQSNRGHVLTTRPSLLSIHLKHNLETNCGRLKRVRRCIHLLSSRTVSATLHSKRDFVDVIKLRTLRWRDCPGLSNWPTAITRFTGEGSRKILNQEKQCDGKEGSRGWNDQLWRWREGPQPKEQRHPLEAEIGRTLFFTVSLQKTSPANTMPLA